MSGAALAQVRSAVLSHAKACAAPAAAKATLALMMHKSLLPSLGAMLGLTLAFALPWGAWLRGESDTYSSADPTDLTAAASPPGIEGEVLSLERARIRASLAGGLGAEGEGVLQVQVVLAESGEPAPGAEVLFERRPK